MVKYKCIHRTSSRIQTWEGTIKPISRNNEYIEAVITGKGSCLHVITGPQINGNFICIPNYDIGSELSSYDDVFWNKERLSRSLGIIDATTVATGLKYIQNAFDD